MSQQKSLGELGLTARSGDAQAQISAIALDSRQVKPGTLFAALPGSLASPVGVSRLEKSAREKAAASE